MDKKDAELFSALAQYSWVIDGPVPLIFIHTDDVYTNNGINFSSLNHLSSIGLISFSDKSGYISKGLPKKKDTTYFDNKVTLEFNSEEEEKIHLNLEKLFILK